MSNRKDTSSRCCPVALCRTFGGPKAILQYLECPIPNPSSRCSIDSLQQREKFSSTKTWLNNDMEQRHFMAATLALACQKESSVRDELSTMTKELASMIMSNDRMNGFLRVCYIRCICILISDAEETIVLMSSPQHSKSQNYANQLLGTYIDGCVINVLVSIASEIEITGVSETDSTLYCCSSMDSICLALGAVFNIAKQYCSVGVIQLLLHHLQIKELISTISSWTILGRKYVKLHPIVCTSLVILKDLCRMVRTSSDVEVTVSWFQAIHHDNLLPELITMCSDTMNINTFQRYASELSIEIIESLLQSVMIERSTLSPLHAILESIVRNANVKIAPPYHPSVGVGIDGYCLHQTIGLVACMLVIRKSKGKKQDCTTQGSKRNAKSDNSSFRTMIQAQIQNGFIITLTWALVHRHDGIREVASIAFQELFCDYPTPHDGINLLDAGYIHIVTVVREMCRSEGRTEVITSLDEAMSAIITSLNQLICDNGAAIKANLSILTEREYFSVSFNTLLLEEFFLIHIEVSRTKERDAPVKYRYWYLEEELLGKFPWENSEEIFTIAKNIMRIYNLVVLKSTYTRKYTTEPDQTSLDALSKLDRFEEELYIELSCKDKIGPVVIRSPPIEKIILNAPLLAQQVSE